MSDARPGIRRVRQGRGFRYVGPSGKTVAPAVRERIDSLAIPPAWTDVWICRDPRGHLQATGRDARGRKQYRYHPRWAELRDETKFHRLERLGHVLPRLRRRVRRDLRAKGLPREKVLATVVRLLEETCIRVGNEEYRRANDSYGLTTLRDRHAEIGRTKIHLAFRGKGGAMREAELDDPLLARIVRACRDLPGYELFQYLDEDGERHAVGSSDVNAYLREATEEDFTAKDFRTWAATVDALETLSGFELPESERGAERLVLEAIDRTAERLGNTRAVCRRSYVHPAVLEAFRASEVADAFAAARRRSTPDLRVAERALLVLLKRRRAAAAA